MAELRAIRIERGPSGFGGPLTIVPTEKRNKVMFITGGGAEPECLAKIVELSGMTPVNGFKTSCPEDELAMVIVLTRYPWRIPPQQPLPLKQQNPQRKKKRRATA